MPLRVNTYLLECVYMMAAVGCAHPQKCSRELLGAVHLHKVSWLLHGVLYTGGNS